MQSTITLSLNAFPKQVIHLTYMYIFSLQLYHYFSHSFNHFFFLSHSLSLIFSLSLSLSLSLTHFLSHSLSLIFSLSLTFSLSLSLTRCLPLAVPHLSHLLSLSLSFECVAWPFCHVFCINDIFQCKMYFDNDISCKKDILLFQAGPLPES